MKIWTPIVVGFAGWLFTGDWLIISALFVLALMWSLLKADEGPPVLAIAMTTQWLQVAVGVFYVGMTGRPLEATLMSDYRPMVAIGLGCVTALVLGLYAGQLLVRRMKPVDIERPAYAMTFKTLVLCYTGAVVLVGSAQQIAWDYPSLTQAIIALTYVRFGILYLVLRRLVLSSRWELFAGVLLFEIALGLTGFFAGFREPIVMASLAMLEVFERRNVRHWITVGGLAVAMFLLSVMWINVRGEYRMRVLEDANFAESRSQRLQSIQAAAKIWASQGTAELLGNADSLIDRFWAIYYPALAIARVPSLLPHTDGQLMMETLEHIFKPRVFFPDKPELRSDSELVRKYSGVFVAGDKEGTTIAFGYSAESYLDYGIPMMFVPVFIYGVLMGLVYAGFLRILKHRDIAVAVVTVICWLSLYLFERSWSKTIGLAGTMVIYVGALTYVFDRMWYEKFRKERSSKWGTTPQLIDHRA